MHNGVDLVATVHGDGPGRGEEGPGGVGIPLLWILRSQFLGVPWEGGDVGSSDGRPVRRSHGR